MKRVERPVGICALCHKRWTLRRDGMTRAHRCGLTTRVSYPLTEAQWLRVRAENFVASTRPDASMEEWARMVERVVKIFSDSLDEHTK